MIRFLARETVDAPAVLLGWLFILVFADTAALIYFWRGLKHQAVAITIVITTLANVLITAGWNYFIWAFSIPPAGERPRVLAWTLNPLASRLGPLCLTRNARHSSRNRRVDGEVPPREEKFSQFDGGQPDSRSHRHSDRFDHRAHSLRCPNTHQCHPLNT